MTCMTWLAERSTSKEQVRCNGLKSFFKEHSYFHKPAFLIAGNFSGSIECKNWGFVTLKNLLDFDPFRYKWDSFAKFLCIWLKYNLF